MITAVAIVGYGWAARMHARAAAANGLRVLAVAGPNQTKRQAFIDEYCNGAVSCESVEQVLAQTAPELVVIASPNANHFSQASACVMSGTHVLVEKPITTRLADAQELYRLAREQGVSVSVGHMWRYHDQVVALRDRVSRGELGRVVRTHGYGVHAKWGPSGWFTELEKSGGGALIDMGIHAIDTARFVLGDPLPVRVQASIGVGCFREDLQVDDDGLLIIDWNNGVRSLVEFGWWQSRLEGLEAETEVVGALEAAQIWPDFRLFPADYEHCSLGMYQHQLADVISSCAAGRASRVSIDIGIIALQIVEEAYAAARMTHQPTRHIRTWEPRWHESH